MNMGIFNINSGLLKGRILRGVIYFLMLVVLAMALINPSVILLPAIILVFISSVVRACKYGTGYVTIALSVCKNE